MDSVLLAEARSKLAVFDAANNLPGASAADWACSFAETLRRMVATGNRAPATTKFQKNQLADIEGYVQRGRGKPLTSIDLEMVLGLIHNIQEVDGKYTD